MLHHVATVHPFMAGEYSVVWYSYTVFLHSSADGHAHHFPFLATVNNAAVNADIKFSVWLMLSFLLGGLAMFWGCLSHYYLLTPAVKRKAAKWLRAHVLEGSVPLAPSKRHGGELLWEWEPPLCSSWDFPGGEGLQFPFIDHWYIHQFRAGPSN